MAGGRVWTQAEDALVRDISLTLPEVSARTGRTLVAVEHKAIKLGVDRSFRVGSGLIPGGGKPWARWELELLADTSLSLVEVAALTGRSIAAVRFRACAAGISRSSPPWQEWELAILSDTSLTCSQVAELTGRNLDSVRNKARALGIQRGPRRGEDHYKWAGGWSVEQSWRGEDWPEVRLVVLERDGYTCQDCGFIKFSGFGLRVHHVIPYRLRPVNDLEWLITLCGQCHMPRPEHRWTEIPGHVLDHLGRWEGGD